MAGSLKNRRSGKDRRHLRKAAPAKERQRSDRRQFPPKGNAEGPSAAAQRLQLAIDEYKLSRGLTRISLDELLGILADLGYRQA
jgi:hypothetical protein